MHLPTALLYAFKVFVPLIALFALIIKILFAIVNEIILLLQYFHKIFTFSAFDVSIAVYGVGEGMKTKNTLKTVISFFIALAFIATALPFVYSVNAYAEFSSETYSTILSEYAEFSLPADLNDITVTELSGTSFNVTGLTTAIAEAVASPEDDLIYVTATHENNLLDLGNETLTLDYDVSTGGRLIILAGGSVIPTLKSTDNSILYVENGSLLLGNFIVETSLSTAISEQNPEVVSASGTADLMTKNLVKKLNNLNNRYSLEFCIDYTTNEYVYLTGLNASDTYSVLPQLKALAVDSSMTEGSAIDAEKIDADSSDGESDTLLCWAGAISNVLHYTGWSTENLTDIDFETIFDYYDEGLATDVDYSAEDAVFKYFKESFTDKGSNAYYAAEWFFNGIYDAPSALSWAQPKNAENGGLLKNLTFDYVCNSKDISFTSSSSDASPACFDTVDYYLRNSFGITLSIGFYVNPLKYPDYILDGKSLTAREGGHAVTLWGYTYDKDYSVENELFLTSLVISDPDDNKITSGEGLPGSTPNKLYRMDITWDTLNNKSCFVSSNYSTKYFACIETVFSILPSAALTDASIGAVVNTANANDPYDGKTSLGEAISYVALNGGDTVTFAPELNGETINAQYTMTLVDLKLTVDASALPDGVTLAFTSSESYAAVFEVNAAAELTVKNVSIAANPTGENMITAFDNYGKLTLNGCNLTNCNGMYGGALYNEGTAQLTDCTISQNNAEYGGGIYNEGTLDLYNCTIINNTARYFGGVYNLDTLNISGKITVQNNTVNSLPNNYGYAQGSSLNVSADLTADSLIGVYISNITSNIIFAVVSNSNYACIGDNFSLDGRPNYAAVRIVDNIKTAEIFNVNYMIDDTKLFVEKVLYGRTPTYAYTLPDGYVLDGWYTESDFTAETEKYSPAPVYTHKMLYGALSYTLDYYVNGTKVNTETIAYGNLPAYEYALPQGYNFDGWYTIEDFDENTVVFVPSETASQSALYGKTGKIPFTVDYYVDGNKVNSETVLYQDLPIYIYVPDVSRNFAGWYTTSSFNDESPLYVPSGTTSSFSLYGATSVKVLTVRYILNGSSITAETVNYGNTPTYVYSVQDGYTFDGWYEIEDYSENTAKYQSCAVTSDFSLYGKTEHTSFTVSFYLDGTLEATENVFYGETPRLTCTAPTGYLINGWYATSDFSAATSKYSPAALYADISLYGTTSIRKISVTYSTDGSTKALGTVNFGESIVVPLSFPEGYIIEHVYVNNVLADECYAEGKLTLNNLTADTIITTQLQAVDAPENTDNTTMTIIVIVACAVAIGALVAIGIVDKKRKNA